MRLALLLATLLTITMGCQPQPRPRQPLSCACNEMSAESAYAVALASMESVPGFVRPPELVLEPHYMMASVATTAEVGDGKYIIAFDRLFFEANGSSIMVGIFAHELWHASDMHQGKDTGSDHELELRADGAAGCALAVAGCQLLPFLAAMEAFGGGTGQSHPGAYERQESAQRGYDSCAK